MKWLAIIAIVFLLGCQEENVKPQFNPGQIIRTTIGDHRGQIVSVTCNYNYCKYDVRFANLDPVLTHQLQAYLKGKGLIQGMILMRDMREFELKAETTKL